LTIKVVRANIFMQREVYIFLPITVYIILGIRLEWISLN